MLMVISPAKTLDFETPVTVSKTTQPEFLDSAETLIEQLRELSPAQVSGLMSISDKLGLLNFDRFQAWQRPLTKKNARPAVLAFKGDVYSGLAAETFTHEDLDFAQQHLRILSGLYGLLRPLDLMLPYRLEMGTRFANRGGANLYAFWGDRIAQALNEQLAHADERVLVNLASQEYFKAVPLKTLEAQVITPVFKDWKNGQYKIISFYAKKARGMMSAYIIKNRLTRVEKIKDFDTGGYRYQPDLSSATDWVFTRREAQ